MRIFFVGAQSRSEKGTVWCTIWLGHEKPFSEILGNVGIWSRLHGSRVFEKALQVKRSVKDYFLLWSTSKMDKEVLHSAVTAAIASITKKKYKFAFVWTALKGCNGCYLQLAKKEPNGNTLVKALHIEVPSDDRDSTYKIMEAIFGLHSDFKILGTQMLLVLLIRPTIPSHKIENIQHLIIKQKQFLDKLYYAKTFDFTEIDYRNPCIGLSLREMLMSVTTLDGENTPIFWSVDYDSYDHSFQLSYPKYLDTQARDIISQLPSLFVYIYGPEALAMMTESAQERAHEAPWDPVEMRAMSQQDRGLEAMLSHAKTMHLYNDSDPAASDDSDDDIDYDQVEIDMDRQATEAFLFRKASSNLSFVTLGTKPNNSKTNDTMDVVSDDDASLSNKPSPKKKQRANDSVKQDDNPDLETTLMLTP